MTFKNFLQEPGSPFPLGVSFKEGKLNFAIVSSCAKSITLRLFAKKAFHPFASYSLSPLYHKTGDIWHISIPMGQEEIEYNYDIVTKEGKHFSSLIDPYAKSLSTGCKWGEVDLFEKDHIPRGKITPPSPFDWEGVLPPRIPMENVIIYEMHVRGFTNHLSSGVKNRGTFSGIIEKIPYLKELGINAIELLPVFEFNECENKRLHPTTHQLLKNVWGYSSISFFALMNRFSSCQESTEQEFRLMVKELHKAGIEVYLDVVYNHTAEGNDQGPCLSYKGFDKSAYYLIDQKGEFMNFSGTGNTFNANHPVTAELIRASLRYYVEEMHIDGFRFDLASCLTRDLKGHPVPNPLVIQMISKDPLLKEVKLIAEAWDAAGLYQVGHFPGGARFSDWNGVYRDTVRRFIKGTEGQAGAFAQAIAGSSSLYKKPTNSINFITCHDGFTLKDLVSYNNKHNSNNGENNQDGTSDNASWNCGAEGPTEEIGIQQLRSKQMKNLHVSLMISLGVPMILMGDEVAHTKGGNNNTYCQDDETNDLIWSQIEKESDWHRFYKKMIHFRKSHPLLHKASFLNDKEILWHGQKPLQANWGVENKFIAFTRVHPQGKHSLFVAFNASSESVTLTLPPPPPNQHWYRVVDTAQPSPLDFIDEPTKQPPQADLYPLAAYSSCILILE